EEPADVPSAFKDDPAVRHAYIRTFVSATFKNSTHDAVKNMLDGYYSSFRTLQAHGVQLEGVENFARTLRTVERRLGVSTEGLITYLFACPSCWKTHRPAELTELDSALCTNTENCTGVLFTVKRMVDGKQKRTPTFLMPLVRPSSAIARMCMQPGKVEQWQQWRGEGDEVKPVSPASERGFAAFADPSKPMRDVCDGWAWRAATAGLERRRVGAWDVRDIDVHELDQRFVALPNGLLLQMNMDWFQSVKNGCHSSGALYTTILNNPRSVRYLREETQLSMMFPGPHEPTLKQLNNAMREFKDDLAMLYNGQSVMFDGKVHDAPVHCLMHNDVSDLPASRKTSALAGCTSIHFMCPLCPATFYSLASVQCYDRSKFILRDPWRYLKYSFRSRDLGIEYEEEIFNRRGIRYSVMHELPNWLPGVTGVIDYMHCTYLCMIKHLCKDILLKTGMLDGAASTKMEALYNKLVWPPSVSRMPPSISRGAGSIKADNWKTQIVILFVALFVAWQVNGEIPASQAPLPSANTNNAKALDNQQRLVWKRMLADYQLRHPNASENSGPTFEDARMDRSYRKHYDTILEFSAALAILSSHAISPNDVKRGTAMHSRAVQAWARMHCHLTPYFHLAMHFEDQYYRFGPCTGWWAFPYERNNGFLGRFKNNGHSGGELECTMMRGWWKTTLIQELIRRLEALPRPHAREDTESMDILRDCLRGGTNERHGSQQIYQARAEYSRRVNLRTLEPSLYSKVWSHLRTVWQGKVELVRDCDVAENAAQISFYGDVQSFSHLWVDNRRYGAVTATRGFSARFGYIDHRIPVQTEYIFSVDLSIPSTGHSLRHTFAVVRRFLSDHEVAALALPWDLWGTDLGVRTWRASALAATEVIGIEQLSGQFVLAPVVVRDLDLWITVAYDRVCLPECRVSQDTTNVLVRF
ncbi:hypothetical protein K525DRAFT_198782, partial [Schizophyllum commune Loenen D]